MPISCLPVIGVPIANVTIGEHNTIGVLGNSKVQALQNVGRAMTWWASAATSAGTSAAACCRCRRSQRRVAGRRHQYAQIQTRSNVDPSATVEGRPSTTRA